MIKRTDSRGHEEDTKESSSGTVSTGKHDKRLYTCAWKDAGTVWAFGEGEGRESRALKGKWKARTLACYCR
jgi:hypothetical protein